MFAKDVFSYPEYCEIAYNWDRTSECDFIEECIRRYSTIEVDAILDIACGPGIHLREFAKRGYEAIGLDKSEEMVEFVNKKAKLDGLTFRCVHSDMKEFQLDSQYGCAICMLDSFRYLLTDADISSHFNSVAKVLKEGGLYILDFWMPKDENVIEWEEVHWAQQDKDILIDATYRQIADTFNSKERTFEDELVLKVRGLKSNFTIKGCARTRLLYLSEFKELVRNSRRFDFIGKFYNFDFDLKVDYNIKPIRTIIILSRRRED